MRHPFEFSRELSAAELVDCRDEVAAVQQPMGERGRLFFIGPRRYGLPLTPMRTALDALARVGVMEEEESRGSVQCCLDAPFFKAGLQAYITAP